MKKRSGVKRALQIIPTSELEGLPTGALLARLKRLRWCLESPELTDLTLGELESVKYMILFKSEETWKQAYTDVKSILDVRENKPNMGEHSNAYFDNRRGH